MQGPLHNFHVEAAGCGNLLSRSAQPSVEGWISLQTIQCLLLGEGKLHHFSLNGRRGPEWVDTEVLDWSVFTPSVSATLAAVGMIEADLKSGRSVHINCTEGSDRTGLLWGALRLRYFGWTFDDVMAERSLYLSAPLIDAVLDLAIVDTLREIAALPKADG